MTFYEESRSYKAWFDYAEPGLLTNRTIRNFLGSYRAETWPDVVKLTLLYGIVTLRKSIGDGEVISLEQIRQRVRQYEAAHCLEEKLPPIHEKMKDLKGDVQEILEAFENAPTRAKTPPEPTIIAFKETPKAADSGIYPDWWGDGTVEEKPTEMKPKKMAVAPREPPRLCYSMPVETRLNVDEDDIVEPKYYAHQFRAKLRQPVPTVKPEAPHSVTQIASSFLNNRWTSALCQTPLNDSCEPEEPLCRASDLPSSIRTLSAACQADSELDSLRNIPRPKSSAFWVDFSRAAVAEAPPPRKK